jgi:SAM-dependent methyltransferase
VLGVTQYATASALSARMALHARFSTNPEGWFRWIFDLLRLEPGEAILEVGCGEGTLWRRNADRILPGCRLLLTDSSDGMLSAARVTLLEMPVAMQFARMDAQSLDVPAAAVDVVVANHMLYHVPDRARAIAEFRRVLRPGGRLVAATNGRGHLRPIYDIAERFVPGVSLDPFADAFGLENGASQIRASFDHVDCCRYVDELVVTEASPLVDYVLSLRLDPPAPAPDADGLREHVRGLLEAEGSIHIPKESGAFVAR